MHTTTQNALEEQSAKLEELKGQLSSCETKLAQAGQESGSSEKMAKLNQRLGAMEKDLSDLKAQTKALKSVLEKVLETDRKVLNKL